MSEIYFVARSGVVSIQVVFRVHAVEPRLLVGEVNLLHFVIVEIVEGGFHVRLNLTEWGFGEREQRLTGLHDWLTGFIGELLIVEGSMVLVHVVDVEERLALALQLVKLKA